MKNKFLTVLFFAFFVIPVVAQNGSEDYHITTVNKRVREILHENPYQSPLENYIARINLWIEGKYDAIHSELIDAVVRQSKGKPYSQKAAEELLNSEIVQVVTYRDSIGLVFRKDSNPDYYSVGMSQWENEKWLATGEDICFAQNLDEAKLYIEQKSVAAINRSRRLEQIKAVPTDTAAFFDYFKIHAQEPVRYLLNKLKNNRLVIYGEVHFRKKSWELLQHLIQTPDFTKTTGTVFLELSVSAQPELDQFFNNQRKNPDIILAIFRKEEITGWPDRGMYDFLMELWETNHKLSNEHKIKVVAVDYQRPFYNEITSRKQYDSISEIRLDRNEIMANTIENQINKSQDKRNNLFIVGHGHAYKSPALLRAQLHINGLSAGHILSEKWGKENVFSIFTHSARITNGGHVYGKYRHGFFDFVFAENGNKPVAFDLKNSPFGNEPFDDPDIGFDIQTGHFVDNFDGYIFLQTVQEEERNTPLYELYTDDYVAEIKRRAQIINPKSDRFWGIEWHNFDRKALLDKLREEDGQKRWKNL